MWDLLTLPLQFVHPAFTALVALICPCPCSSKTAASKVTWTLEGHLSLPASCPGPALHNGRQWLGWAGSSRRNCTHPCLAQREATVPRTQRLCEHVRLDARGHEHQLLDYSTLAALSSSPVQPGWTPIFTSLPPLSNQAGHPFLPLSSQTALASASSAVGLTLTLANPHMAERCRTGTGWDLARSRGLAS